MTAAALFFQWLVLGLVFGGQVWCLFQEVCDAHQLGAYYGPNETTLPGFVEWPPTVDSNGGADILNWFEIGLNDCNVFLANNKETYQNTSIPDAFVEPKTIKGFQTLCRGNEMLYQLTGAITWVFGPDISTHGSSYECPVGRNCWFGVLTCDGSTSNGASRHSAIKSSYFNDAAVDIAAKNERDYRSVPRDIPSEDRFGSAYYHNASYGSSSLSPRALHMNIRVSGDEVVSPHVRYTTMRYRGSLVDVLIANYTLTIPSSAGALIEANLIWFYPGKLFSFPESSAGDDWDLKGTVFLGGAEYRCSWKGPCKYPQDCCSCPTHAIVSNTPVSVAVPPPLEASSSCTTRGGVHSFSLQLCRNGNHQGRWIRLPGEIRQLCNASGYIRQIAEDPTNKQTGPISMEYMRSVQANNAEIVRQFKNIAEDALGGQDASRRGFFEELLRHSDGNHLCMLMDIGVSKSSQPLMDSDRLWLYAPYSCKYQVYSKDESTQCLASAQPVHEGAKPQHSVSVDDIACHGDSMVRDMCGIVLQLLGIAELGLEDLKKLTKTAQTPNGQIMRIKSENSPIQLTEVFSFFARDSSIASVYVTNYMLAHGSQLSRSIGEYAAFVAELPSLKFWYGLSQREKTGASDLIKLAPAFRIFQTGKEMQGKRNPVLEWTSEHFAQRSSALKHHFVDRLGFFELNEFILTRGRLDLLDGWHFGGNAKLMEGMILINIVCNNK